MKAIALSVMISFLSFLSIAVLYANPDTAFSHSEQMAINLQPESVYSQTDAADSALRTTRYGDNNTTGTLNNIVIFINFSDMYQYNSTIYYDYTLVLNGQNPYEQSVKKHFLQQSVNQLTMQSYMPGYTLLQEYTSDHPKSYYINQQYGINRLLQLLVDAVTAVRNRGIIPSGLDIDNNDDGFIDNVTFIFAGHPNPNYNVLIPRWGTVNTDVMIHGKRFKNYAMTFQYGLNPVPQLVHILSHTIGFTNLHDGGNDNIVGRWDIMGKQDWVHYTPNSLVYMKCKYGNWFDLNDVPLIPSEGRYVLNCLNYYYPFSAYRINTNDPNIFYMLEYRSVSWDPVPGTGLIIYCVDLESEGLGNDEVYPYELEIMRKPMLAPSDDAYFSPIAGRTYYFLDAQGIYIHNIGFTTLNRMYFYKSNTLPKVWKGTVSSDWHTAGNWEGNSVPTSTDNVLIQADTEPDYYPVVNSAVALCNNLYLSYGATVTVSGTNLHMFGNLVVQGELIMNGLGEINVTGDVSWEPDCQPNLTFSYNKINVGGDMYFQPNSNVNLSNGILEFTGSFDASIYVYSPAVVCTLRANKAPAVPLKIDSSSTHDLSLTGNLIVETGVYFRKYDTNTLRMLAGSFLSYGYFKDHEGTVSFEGNNQTLHNDTSIESFNHLRIASSWTVGMTTSLRVVGNLHIESGTLKSNNYYVYIKGDWINEVGPSGFDEGDSGTVMFNGNSDQICYGDEFHTLYNDKPSGFIVFPAGTTTQCDSYYWYPSGTGGYRVDGGTFIVYNLLSNPGINGNIILNSGLILYDFTDNPNTNIDLRGNLTINGGSFIINYGLSPSNLTYSLTTFLTMTGGVLEFKKAAIQISTTGFLDHNITGGVIKTPLSFTVERNDFNPTGGTVELYSSSDATLTVASGSSLYNVVIDKGSRNIENENPESASREEMLTNSERDRLNVLTAGSNLQINGNLTLLSGTLDMGAYDLTANGGIDVYGTLRKNAAGSIVSGSDFFWQSSSISDITAGSITFNRNWRFEAGCNVNLSSCPVTISGMIDSSIKSGSTSASFGTLNLSKSGPINPFYITHLSTGSTEPLVVAGQLNINSVNHLYLNYRTLKVGNNVTINNAAMIKVNGSSTLSMSNGRTLQVLNGGTLEVTGSQSYRPRIDSQAGSYTFNVESGGTIAAQYAIFEHMTSTGVNIMEGAIIDPTYPFHYCTFQNGRYAIDARLLNIGNNQNLEIYGIDFPTETGIGAYNIAKTLDAGIVNIYNFTGVFSGAGYELDTFNRINWHSTSCDLVVDDLWAFPDNPYVCEYKTFGLEITNASANPTVFPVRVDLYYDREFAPLPGEAGDLYVYLPPLNAWESDTYEFSEVYSEAAVTWKTWFMVNALNEISETDTTNNTEGYLTTNWLPLPAVETATIIYNGLTGELELTWTYPSQPTVNRFNVYRSASPYGPFDTLVGTPTGTAYSEPPEATSYFYQIRAEKSVP